MMPNNFVHMRPTVPPWERFWYDGGYQRICMKFSLADLLLFFVLLFGTFLKCKYLAGGLQSGQDPPSAKHAHQRHID